MGASIMTELLSAREQAALARGDQRLRWYQARLGFWQTVWGTLITGGIAVAIPAGVDAYKTYQERKLKEQEIALKDKEIEGNILNAHQTYISSFLTTALNQDIELRIRFAEYFSYVSDLKHRDGWDKFREELVKRRDETRKAINLKEIDYDKIRVRQGASLDEQAQRARLERELSWNYAELGYVRQDSNVTAPTVRFSLADYGRGFNGSLRPVSVEALTKTLGEPSSLKETGTDACNPIDNQKLNFF
jgi:hypothetical protein